MFMLKRILVVDDEPNIIELIRMNLSKSGFVIIPALTGQQALEEAGKQRPDLILLDIMLPDIDGLEVLRLLRTNATTSEIPVIMLTARSQETDKVIGLGMGADDYMTKPFGLRELEARVKNALRRHVNYQIPDEKPVRQFQLNDLLIDADRHEVRQKDQIIDLTPSEFSILLTLVENPRQVMNRQDLLNAVPGDKRNQDLRTVDVHIRNLRRKLSDNNDEPRYIETIRSMGYRIRQVVS